MELKVVSEKENPFFERREIIARIEHHGKPTPSKKEVEEYLAKKFGVEVTHIIIDYIFTETGIGESKVKAKIYKKPVRQVEKEEEKEESTKEQQESAQEAEEGKQKEQSTPQEKKEGGEK